MKKVEAVLEKRKRINHGLLVLALLLVVFVIRNVRFYGAAEHLKSLVIDEVECSQLVDKSYYLACYDYGMKGSRAVFLTLEKDKIDQSISKRGRFYEESLIPLEYRIRPNEYTRSGYDRGHMASDASFDYSEDSLHSVYSMVNIVPQNHDLNSRHWSKVEQYSRQKAKEYERLNVLNLIVYGENPKRISENSVAVPEAFYKILWNKERYYEECFYYKNEGLGSPNVRDHKISCKSVEGEVLSNLKRLKLVSTD